MGVDVVVCFVNTDHARAMKKVDPTMKIFWNDNDLDAEKITDFLKITGPGVMDGAEFHGTLPFMRC